MEDAELRALASAKLKSFMEAYPDGAIFEQLVKTVIASELKLRSTRQSRVSVDKIL
jgi:hypothetical protein